MCLNLKPLEVFFYLQICLLISQSYSLVSFSNNFKHSQILNQVVLSSFTYQSCVEISLNSGYEHEMSSLLTVLIEKEIPVVVKNINLYIQHECANHLFLVSKSTDSFNYDFMGRGLAERNKTLIFIMEQGQMWLDKDYKDQFGYATVVVVYGEKDMLYVLDSPALEGRHFRKVPVAHGKIQVLQEGIESKSYVGGGIVRVATFDCPLFSMANNKTGNVEGIEAEIVKETARQLNLSILLVPLVKSNYSQFGFKLDNGSWVGGVMGALYHRTADLGFCALWMSYDRARDVEQTMPWGRVDLTFLVPRPRQRKEHWHTILLPFHLHTWVAIMTTFVLASVCHWLLLKISNFMSLKKSEADLSSVLLGMFGALTQCSSMVSRGRHSLLVFCWYILCVILVALYSSKIVSRLTLPLYTERIDTVKQLVKQGFIWGRPFKSNTGNLLNPQDYWHRKFRAEHFRMLKLEEIHTLMMSGKFALSVQVLEKYYVFSSDFYNLQDSELINLRVMEDVTNQYMVSIQLVRGSPLYPACNLQIQWMLALGLVDYWKRDVVRRQSRSLMLRLMTDKDQTSLSKAAPLALGSFQGAFFFLFAGLTVAFIVFLYEIHDRHSFINIAKNSNRKENIKK